MKSQALVDAFEALAEAPDGIARLRELVLQLAVGGKLVPQDPEDEPASVLLERIDEEKARLIAEGRIRRPKPLPPVSRDETPFETPNGWSWCRLQDIGDWGAGATPRRGDARYYGGSINWFKSGELPDGPMDGPSAEQVTQTALDECSLRENLPGDVLIAMYGATIGKLGLLQVPGTTNQAVCACTCHEGFCNRFLFLFLEAWRQSFIGRGEGGAQPNISKVKIVSTVAPVPPLAEQHRIVAKVEELMALLDQLEAARSAREATRVALRDSALAALRDADTPEEVDVAWSRIAGRMDDLFTNPADVEPLRQTVLQLAVRGRLVPQDPEDEPFLPKGEGSDVDPQNVPHALPPGWSWAELGDVATLINGDRSKNYPNKHEYVSRGLPFINTGHIRPGGALSLDSMHYITRAKFDSLRSGKIEPGDLLYCLRGATIGKTAFVEPFNEGAIASSLVIVRPRDRRLGPYLFRLLVSPHGKDEIKKYDNGSAQPNLAAKSVRRYLVPLPPLPEQQRIVAKVSELVTKLDQLERLLASNTAAHDAFAAAAVHHLDP